MSSLFSVLGVADSGINAMQTWINTTGGNIANANDAVTPGQATYADETTVLSPDGSLLPGATGLGVSAAVVLGSNQGVLEYEPSDPIADAKGDVAVPNVSISNELVNLIQAQDGYQADSSVINKAISAYQTGLTIGD